jgi:hypothetical protein
MYPEMTFPFSASFEEERRRRRKRSVTHCGTIALGMDGAQGQARPGRTAIGKKGFIFAGNL